MGYTKVSVEKLLSLNLYPISLVIYLNGVLPAELFFDRASLL